MARKLYPLKQRPNTALARGRLIIPNREAGGGPPISGRNFAYADGNQNGVMSPSLSLSRSTTYSVHWRQSVFLPKGGGDDGSPWGGDSGSFPSTRVTAPRMTTPGQVTFQLYGDSNSYTSQWVLGDTFDYKFVWVANGADTELLEDDVKIDPANPNFAADQPGNFKLWGGSLGGLFRGFIWDLRLWRSDWRLTPSAPDYFFPMDEGIGETVTDIIAGATIRNFGAGVLIWQLNEQQPVDPGP